MALGITTAKVNKAFTTYTAQGNREDLSNTIYNIDPSDTPVMSTIRRRQVNMRTFDWQTEHLPAISLANAQIEGFQNQPDDSTPTLRVNNVTQISKRDATVSGSQEEVDAAGKGSEMAHQMALIGKVLKCDQEAIMCSRQPRNDGSNGGTPTARQTESITHWIARATDVTGTIPAVAVVGVTTGLPATPTDPFAIPGAPQQVTEAMLGQAMQQSYQMGASPSIWVVPPGPKRTISSFTGRSTSQVLVGKTEVVSTIDVIATDFGRIKVVPSRWLSAPGVTADVGLLIDPDYIAMALLRPYEQKPLPVNGDASSRMIIVEWGIEMRNPLAHILFNGIKA